MEQTKRRQPLIAGLLSFLVPGLGQVYNGRLPKGVLFFLIGCVIDIVPSVYGWATDFRGFVLLLLMPLAFRVVAAFEAFVQARQLRATRRRLYDRWYVYVCVVVVALMLGFLGASALGNGGLEAVHVPAGSMMPAIHVGDRIMIHTRQYRKQLPKRGDIVLFTSPVGGSKDFIKRIVGLEGELIELKDKVVFINGTRLEEPYVVHLHAASFPAQATPRDNMGPVKIPVGQVFVMGDNRDYSHDSRFFGPVPIKTIVGKALYLFWAEDRSRIGKRLE